MNCDLFDAKEFSKLLSGEGRVNEIYPHQHSLREQSQPPSSQTGALFTPGSIGPPKKTVAATARASKTQPATKEIWDAEEVNDYVEDLDPRPIPEYTMGYRQKVTSEDMFLGMSGKCNSIGHCDDYFVNIQLPETLSKDIEMNVSNNILDLRCPRYKLRLPLPVSVNDQNGSAHFDISTHVLAVVLPIQHEFPLGLS
ncbi:hypothetical protein BASA50_007203 [Batrachochytrium salamandrivorans]|uniref:PIH1D1/2/3 CS-like domain-containing protein n=1 Tax=Batrachochytrium salamandrivorans TaxID=1357716 RepID=A0ABQ8F876_9FUNG|nr:hypothetical protein BASA60_011290 [Batrachochytrium salamandrivorans]KAH6593645.1 hypothetical protein BASA50_007203 [Batrachochytrium salamandrivorans]